MSLTLTNPTGMPPRGSDTWGLGWFGAPRDGGTRLHMGLDLQASPYQPVVSPIDGLFVRHKRPYGTGDEFDDGLLIAGSGQYANLEATLFYVVPTIAPGTAVQAGDNVGYAASLQSRYPGITNHVHLGLRQNGEWIDPTPLLFPPAPQDMTA